MDNFDKYRVVIEPSLGDGNVRWEVYRDGYTYSDSAWDEILTIPRKWHSSRVTTGFARTMELGQLHAETAINRLLDSTNYLEYEYPIPNFAGLSRMEEDQLAAAEEAEALAAMKLDVIACEDKYLHKRHVWDDGKEDFQCPGSSWNKA